MTLCSKGQTRQVSTTNIHIAEGLKGGDQDVYSSMTDMQNELVVYCFGQTVGKDRGEYLTRGI